MSQLLLLNKPFNVICQFSAHPTYPSLADYVPFPNLYPAGRLDTDSEGLLVLTNDGVLQHRITDPRHKLPKTYWVQVEGLIDSEALKKLNTGVMLKDGFTKPAQVNVVESPTNEQGDPIGLWPRNPPIRTRINIPTSWVSITLYEGRNRQVRRMTAAVGFPTLRLIRKQIGCWALDDLEPGAYRWANTFLEVTQ
ncbi:MAG: pseudouridine synthase [Pseudomonadota bacterium]